MPPCSYVDLPASAKEGEFHVSRNEIGISLSKPEIQLNGIVGLPVEIARKVTLSLVDYRQIESEVVLFFSAWTAFLTEQTNRRCL